MTLLKYIVDSEIMSRPGKIFNFLCVSLCVSFFFGGVGCGSPFERTMSGRSTRESSCKIWNIDILEYCITFGLFLILFI